jgi:2-polyprenyl-3-methyl-5-hydroxy-6-metoxy-1,4-benzoquinol methylase
MGRNVIGEGVEMMERVLEPEIMDDLQQVQAYAKADFQEENQAFVDNFLRLYDDLDGAHVLDLGCGPGEIAIRLARSHPTCRITGIDASPPMITWAEQAVKKSGLTHRIGFLCQRFQEVNLSAPADAVISNSLVHHVPNPLRFWYGVKNLIKSGGPILVMDLLRPDSPEEAQALVDQYAAHEPERLRQDYFHSLLAAFTEDEVASHLAELNLSRLMVDVPDDRHWMVYGQVY